MSNYDNRKAFFLFIGSPNSGKSTILRVIEIAVGSEVYVTIPIAQIDGNFMSGELKDKKVCADADVAINVPLKSSAISMIKKITSSDKILTNSKYKALGYVRPECKLILATNGNLSFDTTEDLEPLINRMVIFPLERSIPKEEQISGLADKLLEERNYIIHRSLQALHDLVERDFLFTTVADPLDYINNKCFPDGIKSFEEMIWRAVHEQ